VVCSTNLVLTKTQKMKQLYTLMMALLVCTTGLGQTNKKESIDRFLELLHENQQNMGVVAIYTNGKEEYSKAAGWINAENKKPLAGDTRFRIGSISKMFTAVLVFQSIEAGQLSLDTKLSKFYPGIKNADRITISHMLHHKSGIPNFTSSPVYREKMYKGMTEKEVIALIESLPVELEPNAQTSYSNSNYYLLSRILEKVTGESFARLLDKKISQPLKLTATSYGKKINEAGNEAHSYSFDAASGSWKRMEETEMGIPQGAGAVVSNTRDLATFIQALFEGKLISTKSLNDMKAIDQGLGRGMMVFPFYDRVAYGHNGSIDGFESSLAYFPEEKTALVILSNAVGEYGFNNVALGVLSYWFDKPFELPSFSDKPVELSSEQLKAFEGTFANSNLGMKIKLWVQDGALMAQAEGQSGFPLAAFENDTFKFSAAGIVIKFHENRDKFTLLQGGGEFIFEKQ